MMLKTIMLLTGGLSNKTFRVKNSGDVIFKIFDATTNKLVDRKKESEVANICSELGIGPKILLETEGTRIEEFVKNAKPYNLTHFLPLVNQIKMLHSFDYMNKTEPLLFTKLKKWTEYAKQIAPQYEHFYSQVDPMINAIKGMNYTLGLCHNDLHEANILISGENVVLIDFEYSGYDICEFDLANFVTEYGNVYRDESYELDQTKNQDDMIKKVCFWYNKSDEYNKSDDLDKLFSLISYFIRVSHYLWACWAIIKSDGSQSKFPYLQYAEDRFKLFTKAST